MIPVLIISVTIIYYRHDFMDWLYHEHTNESAQILGVLMVSYIFVSSTYISGTLLTAGGHLWHLNVTAGIGLILNILLNLILIPKHGAFGSANASMLTQILIMLVQFILVFRIFGFRKRKALFYRLILFVILLVALSQISLYINLSWLVKAIGLILITSILAFTMGLIRLPILVSMLGSNSEELTVEGED
jgi:O-antigen/teichoic acid export membrane protein